MLFRYISCSLRRSFRAYLSLRLRSRSFRVRMTPVLKATRPQVGSRPSFRFICFISLDLARCQDNGVRFLLLTVVVVERNFALQSDPFDHSYQRASVADEKSLHLLAIPMHYAFHSFSSPEPNGHDGNRTRFHLIDSQGCNHYTSCPQRDRWDSNPQPSP